MITRTTLKLLWLGGGGVLATWLAVAPKHSVPATSPITTAQRPAATHEMSAQDVDAQTARLRSRTGAVRLRQSTRNPFRFNAPKSGTTGRGRGDSTVGPAAIEPSLPAVAPAPPLTLSGVAEKKTPEGVRRTAVILGGGQLYLVGVGEPVAGRYSVVSVDPEAVVLRDAAGAELRLVLRP